MTRPHRFLRVRITTAEPWEYRGLGFELTDGQARREFSDDDWGLMVIKLFGSVQAREFRDNYFSDTGTKALSIIADWVKTEAVKMLATQVTLTRTLFTDALQDDLHERFDPHAESVTIEPVNGPQRRSDDD